MPDTALETRGLTKAFGGFRAVRGLDLKIRRHAIRDAYEAEFDSLYEGKGIAA